jgi:hypothetical protein
VFIEPDRRCHPVALGLSFTLGEQETIWKRSQVGRAREDRGRS